jgi:hypothetical protein
MGLFSIPGNGLKSRIFITAGHRPAESVRRQNCLGGERFPQVVTCGYENKALRAIILRKKLNEYFLKQ